MEKGLQKKILDFINSCPDCIAENVSGNANQSGRADINGCCRGQSFRIELKEPNQERYKATDKQIFNLKKWAAAGAICGICSSVDHVSELLDEYINHCADYKCIKCKFFDADGNCYRQKNGAGVYFCKEKAQSARCANDCQKVVNCYYFREKELLKKVDDLTSGIFYPIAQEAETE